MHCLSTVFDPLLAKNGLKDMDVRNELQWCSMDPHGALTIYDKAKT